MTLSQTTTLVGQPPWWRSTESYALVLLLVSAFCYSAMAAFLQLAVAASGGVLTSSELVLFRATIQGIFVVTAMCVLREEGPENKLLIWVPLGRPPLRHIVVARGMVGGAGFLLYYYSMSVLPLGDATTLLSLYPILTVLLAPLVLHERMHTSHLWAAVGSVVGCLCMTQPSFLFGNGAQTFSLGHMTAMLGSCTGALVFLLIRRAGKGGVHTLQLLFSWVISGIFFSLVASVLVPLLQGRNGISLPPWPPNAASWLYMVGMSLAGTAAHFLLNYAARHAPAGLSSLMRTSGIIWSYILEYAIFGATPTPLVGVGVLLIVLSLAAIALEKYHQNASTAGTGPSYQHLPMTVNDKDDSNSYEMSTATALGDDDDDDDDQHS